MVLGNSIYAVGYTTIGFPIQHTWRARFLSGAVSSRDPDCGGGNVVVSQNKSRGPAGPRRRNSPLDESGVGGLVTVTPLDMPARLRRPDVSTDDAARQLAAPLPLVRTLAVPPADSPARPSLAIDEFACRDNTPGTISNAVAMTLLRTRSASISTRPFRIAPSARHENSNSDCALAVESALCRQPLKSPGTTSRTSYRGHAMRAVANLHIICQRELAICESTVN